MKVLSGRRRFQSGFLAGLLAGIVATLLMLFLSNAISGISLPEVFGSALTSLMPASLFSYLHRLIGGDAKHYLFYGILVGQCLVFALSGGLASLFANRFRAEWGKGQLHWLYGFALALLLWLTTGLLLLPLTGAGLFGAALTIGSGATMLSLALVGATFGLLFVLLNNWLTEHQLWQQGVLSSTDIAKEDTRRIIVQRGLTIIGVGVLGIAAWRFIRGGSSSGGTAASSPSISKLVQRFKSKIVPPPTPNYGTLQPLPLLSQEVTPNDQYYIVSKNLFSDPTVNGSTWRLTVYGQVNKPYTLTYQELMSMPTKKQYESMMCISNEVGGQYMSNALWEGVPLADLLERAGGVKTGATKVVLHAVDDYADSIHLVKALEPTTLVALHMNGTILPQGHGFPARLLVPGIYGMKHVKWITGIEVTNTDFQGYWQMRGWGDAAPIHMTSRIDVPLIGNTLKANRPTYIAGVAFSGTQGISEVDVSLDNGETWQRATLKRPLSNLTWVLWQLPWQPSAGSYTIMVRAVDLAGNVQDPHLAPPVPDGSSGYHTIDVTVM